MQPIADILENRVSTAMAEILGSADPASAAVVKPTQDPRFGDYQANGVMALAKKLKTNPRQLAQQVVEKLDLSDICETPEIAGPGFINLRLKPDWLASRLTETLTDPDRLGVDPIDDAPTTVVDFSGPNLAKQMHVGHLRSTIIGDVIARVLQFSYNDPAKIIRQNHVGDWGLQMGMIICAVEDEDLGEQPQEDRPDASLRGSIPLDKLKLTLDDLERHYKNISERIAKDGDDARDESGVTLEEKCRECTQKLQQGDPEMRKFWEKAREVTLTTCNALYEQLGVKLGLDDVRGESFYNDKLPAVLADLATAALLRESDGAQCVFLEGFHTKQGDPLPLIVQKTDGAYLYATTDLAAIRHRVDQLQADRIIYVTDSRQKLHFQMVFACARQAQWAPENVSLEHVPFGSVLGPDNKPFKTRSGENVKLAQLLDEATQRALKVVEAKNPDLPSEQKQNVAQAVGIGAVKYADLSNNLVGDYVFDWDKMLAMEGNTAPYMQYAYARIQSIFRKGAIDVSDLLAQDHPIQLTEPPERTLAKLLLRYGEIIQAVASDLRPHLLTTYLFELAQAFSGFYTNCPVLKAPARIRSSRLLLCCQTARTISHGLALLGIGTIDQM